MARKIEQKIVDWTVISAAVQEPPPAADVVQMHEKLERPEILVGSTYKVKTPLSEHALYITINDIILNQDTEHEQRRPFEIFINSKNMDHFQWVVALTRVISAVFRKGGDATFLVEELKAVFDPKGGYFKRGGRFMPSLVAEIGEAIEHHMKNIGLMGRLKSRFNVSVSEIDLQDSKMASVIGIAVVSNDGRFLDQQLDTIINFMRRDGRFYLGHLEREIFSGPE